MFNNQILKYTRTISVVATLIFLAVSCTPAKTTTDTTPAAVTPSQPRVVAYPGIEGQDAMSLLKLGHTVETKDFGPGLGEMVQSINGLKPAADEFWAFYVNGKSSNVGASSYITKNSDTLEWRLEKITP